MEPQNKTKKIIGIIIGVLVVGVIALIAIFSGSSKPVAVVPSPEVGSSEGEGTPVGTPVTATSTWPADTSKTAAVFKDGTYSATGTYMSPGGQDQIGVTLTLKDGVITSVTATPEPGDNTSARYQAKFMSGYQALVVGQNIADLNLTKVSGSSLTPEGFDDALTQIRAQAAA